MTRIFTKILSFSVLFLAVVLPLVGGYAHGQTTFLTNDSLRVGVDVLRGGTINYLSEVSSFSSVVNIHDLGRYIQQSYYSGPIPYIPSGSSQHSSYAGWCWNPVQAGDAFEIQSLVLDYSNDGTTIYTKCIPKQWALFDFDSECTMETWVTLDENRVHVRNRLVNYRSDTTRYPGQHQELPAVYTIGTLYRLFTYTGTMPFAGDTLTQIENSGPPWEYWSSNENWSALVNDDGWGLGVFTPGVYETVGGFSGPQNIGGASYSSTGYIAPLHTEILDHDIVYEFQYTLILGDLYDDIRSYVYAHAPVPGPDYIFDQNRQHCLMYNMTDQAPPFSGFWHLELGPSDPQIIFPKNQWQAQDVPIIFISGAYFSQNNQAEIFFAGLDGVFTGAKRVAFTIIPDGEIHTYEVDMSSHPEYTGTITQLRFDPLQACTAGDGFDLYSLTASPLSAVPESKNPDLLVPHFILEPNYPNPFNPRTTICYHLTSAAPVDLRVFDTAGHLVCTLLSRSMETAGTHEVVWDGRDSWGRKVASGAYFYQLRSDDITRTMKMSLVQ